MQIYVHRNNQQLGPFTEAEVKAQLASGDLSLQDHAWWQGQSAWIPLGQCPFTINIIPPLPGPSVVPHHPREHISGLAIGALVANLFCGIGSLVAVVLGHMSLSAIKKDPTLKGHGIALAGLIIGYGIILLCLFQIVILSLVLAMRGQVSGTFKTISDQVQAATRSDSSQNDTDNDSSTNSSDQSTNSAPSTNDSSDSSTNSTPNVTP